MDRNINKFLESLGLEAYVERFEGKSFYVSKVKYCLVDIKICYSD